jgi:hypothetical protein
LPELQVPERRPQWMVVTRVGHAWNECLGLTRLNSKVTIKILSKSNRTLIFGFPN